MTGQFSTALFHGTVVHTRLAPVVHRLRYRVFALLVDLDELPALHSHLRLFGHNRRALFSLYDRDHGAGNREGSGSLKDHVLKTLRRSGVDLDGGKVRLLCYPRIFGYVFNPLSVYYCYHRDGGLSAIIYEVNNTFGERHSYLIPVDDPDAKSVRQSCEKSFYVSPFMPAEGRYEFAMVPPEEKVTVAIRQSHEGQPMLKAVFTGERETVSDSALFKAALRYPLMTVKIIAGIHWEALRLWLKGVTLFRRPAPPTESVTFVRPAEQ